jgi:hypothetical protein
VATLLPVVVTEPRPFGIGDEVEWTVECIDQPEHEWPPDALGPDGCVRFEDHEGLAPPGSPVVRGTVRRLRLVTQRFAMVSRVLEPLTGTVALRDVDEAPATFETPDDLPEGVLVTGLLVDVETA